MQPTSNTPPPSGHQPTSITTSTSSTNENPPAIRTAENRQRNVTVRRDEESSEDSTEDEARSGKTSQVMPAQEDAHEKASEQGRPQQPPQASLPRYIEPGASTITAGSPPGASASSATAHTSDVPQPVVDPSGAYRLQLEQWIESAHDVPMACRQEVKAEIEKYLRSPEKEEWTLRFSGLGLTSVPPLPSDLKRFDVSDNQLSALPEHLPAGLQMLDVGTNQLSALPEHLPAGLQKLEVNANQLSALPEHLPAGLQMLDVNANQLSALPEHLPAGLQELDVGANQLSALPERLPAGLQMLDVSDNQLSALPEHLPAGLQKLYVSDNQLSALPERLPEGLQTFSVRDNQLSALPEHLPAGLQVLYADGNQLTALPEHLPEGLRTFSADGNQLTALPEHLPAGLQELHVANNQLSALPELLPAGLGTLTVTGNQLTALPEHLPAGLQVLYVGGNQLSSFPPALLNVISMVDVRNNPLSITVLERLRQITSAPDYRGPRIRFSMAAHAAPLTLDSVRPLNDAIQNWLGKESTPWAKFVQEEGATEFSLFLDKLAQSIIGRDPAFRTTFQSWLRDMARHPSLRAHVFAVARGATASCQDRVMLTVNDMARVRLLFQVERGDYDQRLPELVDIARGMFRLEKLEVIARKKAESLKLVDEVEVYLAYQVKLRGPLRLPLVVGEMAYFKISGVNEQDLLAAEATVKELENREFKDFLLTWQPWLQASKKGSGLSDANARARQFALWDMEYEQPLAGLEVAIAAIDSQLNNGSSSTSSSTGQTGRLQVERQGLTAQRNALTYGARVLSDDIARRVASGGNVQSAISPSLLEPVWDNDGGYAADSADVMNPGFHAAST